MNLTLDKDLNVEVLRTKRRKTASIKINNGAVQAIVPDTLSNAKIQQILLKRSTWIRSKLLEQAQFITPKPKEYLNGENFSYLGRNYRLKVLRGQNRDVKLKGGYLQVQMRDNDNELNIRTALAIWYEHHARIRLNEKTQRYAEIIGVQPNSITVRNYKARWGSCSPNREISYNWRIIIAPHPIVDYVVVHELCHILHPNHSPAFWNAVKRFIPNHQDCRQWLKQHSASLVI